VVCVLLQRPGSIIVDYEISSTINSPANFVEANSKVAKNLQYIGYRVALDAFAESGKVVSIYSGKFYHLHDYCY